MPVLPRWRHDFDLGFPEARALQERLRARVREQPLPQVPRRIAGVDVSYDRGSPLLFAAVVVLDAESGERVAVASARARATFPYVPGYLSFREIPPLLRAFERLAEPPDLVVVDGHGRAHPRRFGIACHLGVLLDLPSVGCAKSRLLGTHREPGSRRGCATRLLDGGEVIGSVLRTRDGVKPVYVSVGHRITLEEARRTILALTRGTRLAEPIRAAHAEVNRLRRIRGGRRERGRPVSIASPRGA